MDFEEKKEEIFAAAIEIEDRSKRESYIAQACGEDRELLENVQKLLHYHDENSFLDVPALESVTGPEISTLTEHPGMFIGRYKLLEKIGEGGMAVVYMAEQAKPIRRKVALKIIKLGMDTKSVIARFEAERQALAMMDHPNIAKVLDAGATETGRPYFVMELVTGVSITEYCDKNNLNTKERLALFIQVCNAVQHAHQKGIIHRDIKPSNVMVSMQDDKPVPKVIDFGIAKATKQRLTEKTLFTRYAHIIGTPAYMSPEQAELNDLDVDTRTDIYSLGILLYELLAGTTPFSEEQLRKAGYIEMQRVIREEEPEKPSTKLSTLGEKLTDVAKVRSATPDLLRKAIQGDLDWVVMKSLEKDRARRYGTASEFAEDLDRHLNDEPVRAAAPGAFYKFGKFVRRHRIGVIAGVLIASVILLAVATLSVSTVWIWKLQSKTEQALDGERIALQREIQARSEAERQTKIAQAVADFLNYDLLASAHPDRTRGQEMTVLEMLDAASHRIEGRFNDEPLIEASIRLTLGKTYTELGEYNKASLQLDLARQLHQLHLPKEDSESLRSLKAISWLHLCQERYDEAEVELIEALKISKLTLGEENAMTLGCMTELAILCKNMGQQEKAEDLYVKALAIMERALGESHLYTLNTMHNLATLYSDQERYPQAEALYDKVLEIKQRKFGEDHPDTLRTMCNLSVLYKNQGQYKKAQAYCLRTWKLMERVLGKEHPDTLRSMSNLAVVYSEQKHFQEAEKLFDEILAIKQQRFGPEHPDTLRTMDNLGLFYKKQEQYEKAKPYYLKTFEIRQRVFGKEHQDTLVAMSNLADIYGLQERFPEAEFLLRKMMEIRMRTCGEEHKNTLNSMTDLAILYSRQEKYEDARPLFEKCIEIRRRILGDEHRDTLRTMKNMALLNYHQQRYEEAESLYLKTVKAREKLLGGDHRETIETIQLLVSLYEAWEKPEQAQKWQAKLPEQVSPDGPSNELSEESSPSSTPDILAEAKKLVGVGTKASWSPKGNQLVFNRRAEGSSLHLLDVESGEITDIVSPGKDPVWSPDGRFIAYVTGEGVTEETWFIKANGESPQKLIDGGYPVWSVDGKRLYVHSRKEKRIFAVAVDEPDAEPEVFFDRPESWYPAISPDTKFVAFGRSGILVIYDRRTGQRVLTWPTPGARGVLPAWSPDGRYLAYGGFNKEDIGLWLLDVKTRKAIQVATGPYTMPAWSSDGRNLAFDLRSDEKGEIWMVETNSIQGPQLGAAEVAGVRRASPQGRTLKSGSSATKFGDNFLMTRKAPPFVLQDLNGQHVSLSDFEGKVVLLDFWATWCGPCVKTIPHLEALHNKYKDKGLAVIGLNMEEDHDRVRRFAKDRISYPVLLDARNQFTEYGVRAIPTLYYVNKEGKVSNREIGFNPDNASAIESRIRRLLGLNPDVIATQQVQSR